jgi:Zn-dependent protease
MWRRDNDKYDDYGNTEVKRVFVIGGREQDMFGMREPRRRKFSFSETELKQLGLAILLLSIAFALALSGFSRNRETGLFIVMLIVSFIIVSTGFALHEIAHKLVAQSYGHWAEFRYSEMGLFMALIFGFIGFLIAVPGAVYISGRVTEEQNGKISAAGPLTNVLLALLFLGIFALGVFAGIDFLILVGYFGALINPIIAAFNMIPIHPLDGSKILRWNISIYILMAIIIGILLVFAYAYFVYGYNIFRPILDLIVNGS